MPQPTKGPRFGGSPAHQKHILSNLAQALFEHGKITTTEAKARRLRPFAERLITKAKRGDLHNRRQVASVLPDKTVVHILFTEIAPKMAERPGGYTRITKLGPRKGDNAPMAVIEMVDEEYVPGGAAKKSASAKKAAPAKKTAKKAAKKSAPASAESEVVETEVVETEVVETEEPMADEAATDEAATDEAATDEAATDEAATDEAASDEVVTDEATTDEAASDEAATDESATDEAAAEGDAKS